MKLTLLEILLLVLVLALGVGGLVSGPPISWLAMICLGAIIGAQLISALVATGCDRAGAIGFLLPGFLYIGAMTQASEYEFDYGGGVVPTSQFFQTFVEPVNPDSNMNAVRVMQERRAYSKSIVPLGHLLVAIVLGIVGSRYARFVYNRSRAS